MLVVAAFEQTDGRTIKQFTGNYKELIIIISKFLAHDNDFPAF